MCIRASFETVPLVVGSEEAAAVQVLENKGFVPVVEHGYSEEYPAGLVMEQSVDYGKRLRRGEEVLVTVSDGSQWVYFDDMTGWTLEQVDERLTQLGFSSEHVSVTYIVSDQDVYKRQAYASPRRRTFAPSTCARAPIAAARCTRPLQ